MNIININYGYSYKTKKIKGSDFTTTYFKIDNNGCLNIDKNTNVGDYNVKINYINIKNKPDEINYKIIIKPKLFYDLLNVTNSCVLKPICHPELDNGIFKVDIEDNNININSETGIINIENLNIGNYNFNVYWDINNIQTNYFINFTIKPEFYYINNKKTIYYGDIDFSEKPFINTDNYEIICKYKITDEGVLDLKDYDVGDYKIEVKLKCNDIIINTFYYLYVKPKITYLNLEYICYALILFTTDIPIVSQLGGKFTIDNLEYFKIENKGQININAPSGIYIIIIKYAKNNTYNETTLTFNVKPIFSYNNMNFIYSSDVVLNSPISNEIINGNFKLINNYDQDIIIDNDTGIISFNKIIPNIYNIIVEYTKNNCISETNFKVEIYPFIDINNNNFIIYPDHLDYSIICDNLDVKINNKILNLSNLVNVNHYILKFTITINNMLSNISYNYDVLPTIIYDEIFYTEYNIEFKSKSPLISNLGGIFSLLDIENFIIDNKTGIVTGNNLIVGEYILNINYEYLDFNILSTFKLIVQPYLKINNNEINFIYSEYFISQINYLPIDGSFIFEDILNIKSDDDFINILKDLNCGTYNINIIYTYNNISTSTLIKINIKKKEILLNLYVEDKEYDESNSIIIKCKNYTDIIITGYYEDINYGNKKIIIEDIILPDNLNINYYTNISNIKLHGNIIQKILYPNIITYDKIYDGNLNTNIKLSLDINEEIFKIESYNSKFKLPNIGYSEIEINNIKTSGSFNYKLSKSIYICHANIFPKKLNLNYTVKDKIYDGTNNCDYIITNIENLTRKENIQVNIKSICFSNHEVGEHDIEIKDYEIIGNNSQNYIIEFKKLKSKINPQKLEIKITSNDKIYDGTLTPNLSIICDQNIISYDAYYNDNIVTNKKKIYINNFILENKNYFIDNLILYGNIIHKMLDFIFYPDNKIYDDTSLCTGTYNINKYNDDDVICIFTAEFKNINSGDNIEILIKNLELIGKDANNYKIGSIKSLNASIYKKELIYSFTSLDKMYDKTTNAIVEIDKNNSIDNILFDNYDNLIISLDANYEDYFIGNNKIIYIKNIKLENKLHNYFIKDTTCIGNILLRKLEIIFNKPIKTHNETTDILLSINNIKNILDDDIIYVQTVESNFDNSDVGNNKTVFVNNIILNEYGSKYYYSDNIKIEGDINPKILNIKFVAEDQLYNSNLKPKLSYSIEEITNKNILLEIVSYDAYYENISVGLQKIIISNILLNNKNYIAENQILFGNIILNNIIDTNLNIVNDTKLNNINNNKFKKKINIKFTIADKIYDGTNEVIFDKIYCKINIISFDSYYDNCNVGERNVIIKNIKLEKICDYDNEIITIKSIIKPKLLKIEFKIAPKIYDKNKDATISSYIIITNKIEDEINNTEKIKIYSYFAEYESVNVGEQKVIIKNVLINSNNYYTDKYYSTGLINPREININFENLNKEYNKNKETNLSIESINNKILDDSLEVLYFTSLYDDYNVGNNINININDIYISGLNITNYIYNKNIKLKGNITPKKINCNFTLIDNTIVGTLINNINNENIWISNYISYKKNNEIYIQNVVLDGLDKNNYILYNKIYQVI